MPNDKTISFQELARAKVQDKRDIVISRCNRGGYTIGMQLKVEEGKRTTGVFMKGAHQVDDIDGLYELRNALNIAIEKEESGTVTPKDDEEWD